MSLDKGNFLRRICIQDFWIESKAYLLFVGKFLALYLLLTTMELLVRNKVDSLFYIEGMDVISYYTGQLAVWILNIFQFSFYITPSDINETACQITKDGQGVLLVTKACGALHNQILLISLVGAFPTRFWVKIIFLLPAIAAYQVANAFRLALLTLVSYSLHNYYDVLKYPMNYSIQLMFLFIILIWYHISLPKR